MPHNKKIIDKFLNDWINTSTFDLYSKNLLDDLSKYEKVEEEKPEALTRKVLIEKTSKLNIGVWQFLNEHLRNTINNDSLFSSHYILRALNITQEDVNDNNLEH